METIKRTKTGENKTGIERVKELLYSPLYTGFGEGETKTSITGRSVMVGLGTKQKLVTLSRQRQGNYLLETKYQ